MFNSLSYSCGYVPLMCKGRIKQNILARETHGMLFYFINGVSSLTIKIDGLSIKQFCYMVF